MKTQSTTRSGSKTKTKTKTAPKKKTFTHEQIMKSLYYVHDTMERCMMEYVVLDDIARNMKFNERCNDVEEVSVGIRRPEYSDSARRMLISLWPKGHFTKVNVGYEHEGVPIVIWILEKDLSYMQKPDTIFYDYDVFKIPNPFDLYWHNRDLIG